MVEDDRFCPSHSRARFEAYPARYVAAKVSQGATEGRVYACPMHPAVRRPEPGICPKCGMGLEAAPTYGCGTQLLGTSFEAARARLTGAMLAHRASAAEPQIGILLPCNAVVQQNDGGVVVPIANARAMFSLVENPDLEFVAKKPNERFRRVIETVGGRGAV